jgi:hypothetical protein
MNQINLPANHTALSHINLLVGLLLGWVNSTTRSDMLDHLRQYAQQTEGWINFVNDLHNDHSVRVWWNNPHALN